MYDRRRAIDVTCDMHDVAGCIATDAKCCVRRAWRSRAVASEASRSRNPTSLPADHPVGCCLHLPFLFFALPPSSQFLGPPPLPTSSPHPCQNSITFSSHCLFQFSTCFLPHQRHAHHPSSSRPSLPGFGRGHRPFVLRSILFPLPSCPTSNKETEEEEYS